MNTTIDNNEHLARSSSSTETRFREFNHEDTSAIHLAYIEKNWEILAAIAWKEFTERGRGALVLEPEPDSNAEWGCMYLPSDELRKGPQMTELIEMVMQYVPSVDVVAIFLTPPASVSAYSGSLTPERLSPPEAYAKLAPILSLT